MDLVFLARRKTKRDNMLHKLCHLESFSHLDLRIAQRKSRSRLFPAVHLHKTRPIPYCTAVWKDIFFFMSAAWIHIILKLILTLLQSYGHFLYRVQPHSIAFGGKHNSFNNKNNQFKVKTTNLRTIHYINCS